MKKIVIASKNPVKINAALLGFEKMFPDEKFDHVGVSVASGVNDQPMSDSETYQGALNRAENASKENPDADFWVGMEGGCEQKGDDIEAFAWMVIKSKEDVIGKGRTSTFFLPSKIVELIHQGKELGHASDIVFNESNSKQKGGTIGILTDDLVDRTKYYEQAIILALIPFKNQDLFS